MKPDVLRKRIQDSTITRTSLLKMRNNCALMLQERRNIELALEILEIIDTTPFPTLQNEYVFMGYCPGSDIRKRVDKKWLAGGFCDFLFMESKRQVERFCNVLVGDVLILKKRQQYGKTMRIHAWGRVTRRRNAVKTGMRWLEVNWTIPPHQMEVPLMGCNQTVNPRSLAQVEEAMPVEFWDWLQLPNTIVGKGGKS